MRLVQVAVLCGSTNIFCWRKVAVVLRKAAEGLRFDCGQYGSLTVFALYLRFLAVSAVRISRKVV